MMIIRDATVKDVAAIAALHADSWRSGYRTILSDDYLEKEVYRERLAVWQERFSRTCQKAMFVMVAEANLTVVGFVCVFPDEDSVFGSFLDNLHVAPRMTGQGIGRKLLSEAVRHLATNGSRSGLYLWVIEQNERARRFYEKAGARVVGSKANTMPDNTHVVALRCYWNSPETLVLKT
jgi:ribosomal protein S18 acetylase RimI-like enzyme